MRTIVRLPKADNDLDEIWAYIAQDNPTAAYGVIKRIIGSTARLGDYPLSGPALGIADFRTLSIPPYMVVYKVSDDAILIVRVIHAARDIRRLNLAP